jgi:hypothetical protein
MWSRSHIMRSSNRPLKMLRWSSSHRRMWDWSSRSRIRRCPHVIITIFYGSGAQRNRRCGIRRLWLSVENSSFIGKRRRKQGLLGRSRIFLGRLISLATPLGTERRIQCPDSKILISWDTISTFRRMRVMWRGEVQIVRMLLIEQILEEGVDMHCAHPALNLL